MTADTFNVGVERRKTANGGWEWFLTLGGVKLTFGAGVGIFTDADAQVEDVFPRLLATALKSRAFGGAYPPAGTEA